MFEIKLISDGKEKSDKDKMLTLTTHSIVFYLFRAIKLNPNGDEIFH